MILWTTYQWTAPILAQASMLATASGFRGMQIMTTAGLSASVVSGMLELSPQLEGLRFLPLYFSWASIIRLAIWQVLTFSSLYSGRITHKCVPFQWKPTCTPLLLKPVQIHIRVRDWSSFPVSLVVNQSGRFAVRNVLIQTRLCNQRGVWISNTYEQMYFMIFLSKLRWHVLITASIENASIEPLNMTFAEVTWIDTLKIISSPLEKFLCQAWPKHFWVFKWCPMHILVVAWLVGYNFSTCDKHVTLVYTTKEKFFCKTLDQVGMDLKKIQKQGMRWKNARKLPNISKKYTADVG